MEVWTSRSRPGRQLAIALLCATIGAVLLAALHGGDVSRDAKAARLLGVVLVVIGVGAGLTAGTQTVTVDPRARSVTVTDARLLGGTRTRTIVATDIREVGIGYLGRSSNHVRTYYLNLKLRDGHDYPLFAPGRFYPGSSDRATVEGWRRRLAESLALPA